MAQLHVVRAENRYLYQDVLSDYFQARHHLEVDECCRLGQAAADEIDSLDGLTTVYLIALEGRRVVGAQRLVPTRGPTLMGNAFPQLAATRHRVCRPDAYELSRMFVMRDRRGDAAQPPIDALVMAGTLEYGLLEGIRQFTLVCATAAIPRFLGMGWRLRPLGLPVVISGTTWVGMVLDVDAGAWRETLRACAIGGRVLRWNGLEPVRMAVTGHASVASYGATLFQPAQESSDGPQSWGLHERPRSAASSLALQTGFQLMRSALPGREH